jgi:hypothetical protein
MRLARYALAFGLGYAAGHPAGREKLRTVPTQVNELAHRPEAERLKERGKALAGQAVQSAKQRLGRGATAEGGAGNGKPTAGRTGPTVVEETVVVTETTGAGTTGTATTGTATTGKATTGKATAAGKPGRKGGTDVGASSVVDKDAEKDAAMHGTLPPTQGPGSAPR